MALTLCLGDPPAALAHWASLISSVATPLGVAVAASVLWWDRVKERRSRELTAYTYLSSEYREYLSRCIEDPVLATPDLGEGSDRKQDLHISMVISLLEAAYFLFREQGNHFKKAQWDGWNEYMKLWIHMPEVRERWDLFVRGFDKEFVAHLNSLKTAMAATNTPARKAS